ncbi:hypothetical protein [Streptomyces sp. NPDC059063]|uniref:hypothetical protein n=1 Tax=unclassified Streptomyces TaxID=2593676 RepID=UPI003675626D
MDAGNAPKESGPEKKPSGSPSASPKEKHEGERKQSRQRKEKEVERGRAKESSAPDKTATSPSAKETAQGGTPVTARVRPYAYENQCTQHFLVNRGPGKLPQPPAEPEAPAWVRAFDAVPAGEQFVEVTLQGTGKDTVVLNRMNVRVVQTRPPLAWNDYATGVGCGGDVTTRSFRVDLDSPRPVVVPKNGQRGFPYKVSESDPEVFYVKAGVTSKYVTWYLEVEWSSGDRHGVLAVNDRGQPFRTSGAGGRPQYQWPLGGEKWDKPTGG